MHVAVTHQDLFPTRIWKFDLSAFSGHFPAWRAAVEAMRSAQPSPSGRSNRGGWNSDKTVFERPEFALLAASVRQSFVYALRQVTGEEVPVLCEAWVNMHERGAYNAAHVHQGALLSGTFYLTVPEGSGNLVLRDPRPGVVLSPFRGQGANSARHVQVQPHEGLLVVFPNWLEHEVALHEADTPRVAIAINAIPPMYAGATS